MTSTLKNRIFFLMGSLACLVAVTSCQTYTTENQSMRNALYEDDLPKATKQLDESGLAGQNRNKVLFNMEKGMLFYLSGQYRAAANLWMQADHRLDELYTTSVSKTLATYTVNDTFSDYQGESHERILLPLFSSLSFFANGDLSNSLVMIRRLYDIANVMESENYGQKILQDELLSHYFSAFIYESKKEWDAAIIEYRNTWAGLEKFSASQQEKDLLYKEVLSALGRLAEYRHRTEIVRDIKKSFPHISWRDQNYFTSQGEVFVVYECGKSPIKVPEEILVPHKKTTIKIAFPKYEILPYASREAQIFVDGGFVGKTLTMENIGKMAAEALAARKTTDLARMIARIAAKTSVVEKETESNPFVGAAASFLAQATETADTRSWTTLPDTIQIARLVLPPNRNIKVDFKPDSAPAHAAVFKLAPGEKVLYRFRTFH